MSHHADHLFAFFAKMAADIVVETGPTDAAALGFDRSNDTVLAALRPHAAGQTQPSYTYLAISLDRGRCSGGTPTEASGSVCEISAAQFFGGVLAHALKWKPQFEGGMEASIPYAERRQVDMAKGVIVSASTVFIGHAPNCEYLLDFGPSFGVLVPVPGILGTRRRRLRKNGETTT